MNPQEAKEFVRRKVIECMPSILDLKFGCVVVVDGVFMPERITGITVTDADIVTRVSTYTYSDAPVGIVKKIIGRDIRLSDVLATFGDRIGNDDRISDFIHGCTWSWNLLDDSLDNQSPETWVELAEMMR